MLVMFNGAALCESIDPPSLSIPPRPADSVTGSEFARQIEPLSRDERETAILKQVLQGNIPNFLRYLAIIRDTATDSNGQIHRAMYFVTPDYLAIGSDEDFFRIPMTPKTAQAIAAGYNASLITKKMCDSIYTVAQVKLEPQPLTKDREAVATFYQHHEIIEAQRKGKRLGLLIAGIKKDVVLTNRLKEKPNRVAIYGWHHVEKRVPVPPNAVGSQPIQPLYVGHVDWYVDYSHGIRLVSQEMVVDGRTMKFRDVLRDKELSALISDEGPIEIGY